jgi:hypothetical protein
MKSSLPFFISLILISLFFVGANASVRETEHSTVMKSVATLKGIDENDWDYCGLEAVVCEKESPEAVIRRVAQEENFDQELLLIIAYCESRFKNIKGEIDNRDRGIFQINSQYNPSVSDDCAFDYECATKWAINEIKNGNIWKWNSSKQCWLNN